MSIQAVSWVLDYSTTRGAHRLVLISLANHANEDGECWPSHQRIAAEAALSEKHVKRCLVELSREGHILRGFNAAPDSRMRGDRRTNLYVLLHGGAQKYPPWLDGGYKRRQTGGTTTTPRGPAEVPPNHHLIHQEPGDRLGPEGPPPPKPAESIAAARARLRKPVAS